MTGGGAAVFVVFFYLLVVALGFGLLYLAIRYGGGAWGPRLAAVVDT
jgi:hypothetical protein